MARPSTCSAEALETLVRAADGDARRALNLLEVAVDLARASDGAITETIALPRLSAGGYRRFDKEGEQFYDQISALHKSVRGTDPDAALYWLCRMLDGGCDPRYVARRVLRMASEDIGNADPRALALALEACEAYERLGSPEGELAIAQAVVFLACAAKSNAVYVAFGAAMDDAKRLGTLEVPLRLRNAPTGLMKDLGYGKGYRYAHDEPEAYAAGEKYFPDEMAARALLRARRARTRDPDPRGARTLPFALPLGGGRSGVRVRPCFSYNPLFSSFPSPQVPAMLDAKLLRTDLESVARNLARRGFELDVEHFRALEERRKAAQVAADEIRAARNAHAKKVGMAKGKGEDIASLLAEGEALARKLAGLDQEQAAVQAEFDAIVLGLPNLLHDSVPDGRDESANVEVRRWGTPREFEFTPLDHVAIGEKLALVDFEAAGRISGARFVVLKGGVARLQRALIQYMLDLHTSEHGYTEVYAPYLVSRQALVGTGQLPKFEADLFRVVGGESEYFLIPTAEVPVTNLVREAILEAEHVAAQIRRAHAVLPLGGRLLRQGHARHDPPAPVREGRAGADGAPGGFLRGARGTHRSRRSGAEGTGIALPRGGPVRRRHRFWRRQDLRSGGLAARAAEVPRDLLVQQLRGVPGAAHAGPLAQPGDRQARAVAHAEWFRRRGGPCAGRGARELPAGGRQRGRARGAAVRTWAARKSFADSLQFALRRGGRAVECTGLENRRPRKGIVGSNPTLSANSFRKRLTRARGNPCGSMSRGLHAPV